MNIENLKEDAKEMLANNWVNAIIVTIVIWLLKDAFTQEKVIEISKAGTEIRRMNGANIISLILSGPLSLGVVIFYMKIESEKGAAFTVMFEGFKDFKRSFFFHIVSTLFVVLWTLLLIVPGIIASIRYSLGYYLMAEDKSLEAMDAIKLSSELMYGHKMEFFRMTISFFGWFILSIITFGIGFLYTIPYYQMTKLNFYRQIKSDSFYNII